MNRICLSLAVAVAAFAGTTVMAQEDRGRRSRRGGMDVEELKTELGLSDEQAESITKFNEEARAGMREMWEKMRNGEGGFDRSKMREMMTERREAIDTKVKALLTDEQKEKYTKYQEERRARRSQGWQGRRGDRNRGDRDRGDRNRGPRLKEAALKALALDEEVAAVVTPLLEAVLESRKTLREALAARRKALLETLEGTDEAGATELLAEFRNAGVTDADTRRKVQDALREILTVVQEAKLIALGVLNAGERRVY